MGMRRIAAVLSIGLTLALAAPAVYGILITFTAALTLPAGEVLAQSHGGATLDHFQCYEIRPPAPFDVTGLAVVDAFGSSTVDLRKVFTLCAPANKNGEDSAAPAHLGHLTSYGIKRGARFERVRDQVVSNQFGDLHLDVVKPARLLVPTAKSLAGPPSSPAPGLLDHFQCYKVKRTRGAARFAKVSVSVQTQFETTTESLVRPLRLCAPADKNGESPGAEDHPDHLLCYRTKNSTGLATTGVFLNNQFGQQSYSLSQRREFCVPSTRN